MKIIELQKQGDNLYLLTYKNWYGKVIERHIYQGYFDEIRFADNGKILSIRYCAIINLIKHLKGYKPLTINSQ